LKIQWNQSVLIADSTAFKRHKSFKETWETPKQRSPQEAFSNNVDLHRPLNPYYFENDFQLDRGTERKACDANH